MGLCWSSPPPVQTSQTIEPVVFQVQPPAYVYPPQQNQIVVISVKTLTGKVFPVTIYLSETIYQVKQKIYSMTGILPERQVLIYMGKELDNNKYVFYYQIFNGITIHLVIRM